jgi:RNA polymerase sigma-70 factor (ECF subfamily)
MAGIARVESPVWAKGLEPLLDELFASSRADQFGFTASQFARVLVDIGIKYLPPGAKTSDARTLFTCLRVEELALARGCANGNDKAWEVFLTRFREKLYDVAGAITRDDAIGHELADSLYAALYGLTSREGERVSKLASYTGRGSLEGWLRTVLAQEYVNRYRQQRRLVSLDEEEEAGKQFEARTPEPLPSSNPRLDAAVDEALASLPAEDRMVLASYFLDDRTLADIAKMLRVHESTISRRIDKITRNLRGAIMTGLERQGMSRRQAEEALETDVRDLAVDVRARLEAGRANSQPGAQKPGPATFSG